jgi:predicted hotdog family 3-hydroxylacyl-ACP dehydratase
MTAPLPMGRDAIARLIPHSGAMCLLDTLLQWDGERIVCSTDGHRDPAHPLRTASGLLAPCAIEYAAQAMALHGALIGQENGQQHGGAPSAGYLASTRGVRLHRLHLEDLPGTLTIEAVRQAGDGQQILYRFSVTHGDEPVADGRATVVLNTPFATPAA